MHLPHLQLPHFDLENYKGVMHMAMFFIVLFKAYAIDKKLSLLEKKFAKK